MNHFSIKLFGAVMLMAALAMGSAHAKGESADIGAKPHAAKAKKKSGQGGQIKFLPGSGETVKERSTRLKGECKGRVNAGACAGYTG